MKLIKSRLAWRRWLLASVAGVYRSDLDSYKEPTSYPCYAYAVVQSFGYEEEQPMYLYQVDVAKMVRMLEACHA